jgi:hypothetical protein
VLQAFSVALTNDSYGPSVSNGTFVFEWAFL